MLGFALRKLLAEPEKKMKPEQDLRIGWSVVRLKEHLVVGYSKLK